MSDKQHTPGPWEARSDRPAGVECEGEPLVFWDVVRPDPRDKGPADPNRDLICDCGPHRDAESNARLIAAAPDLLAAAKQAREYLVNLAGRLGASATPPELELAFNRLRLSIDKATGG